ncbi:head-tail adaptor protein [Komagataeibacter xylinus]|uniref:Head-tail adaptor protein n=1 Tax=Komagataeibacter xylinus TaxID=28448 RepID=A0A857FMC9_KOMXY|nr:head-tail adaptor protein [Komagataeibacter xylinus]QHC35356.1 head-tail adaptor protein [Komagataeibacter xylinus]
MPEPQSFPLGRLRWPVQIVQRGQAGDPNTTGVLETLIPIRTVRADVQPVGALTFWGTAGGNEQVDTPVTHRIYMRWQNSLPNAYAITRSTTLDDGTTRTEVFRVRRIKEIDGRKRFVIVECEEEKNS